MLDRITVRIERGEVIPTIPLNDFPTIKLDAYPPEIKYNGRTFELDEIGREAVYVRV